MECHTCGGSVSSAAEACPHCGEPYPGLTQDDSMDSWQDDSMESWVPAVLLSGFIAVCVFFGLQMYFENTAEFKKVATYAHNGLLSAAKFTELNDKLFHISLAVAVMAFLISLERQKDGWFLTALTWASIGYVWFRW